MVATSELLRPTTHPHPEVTTAGRVGRIAVATRRSPALSSGSCSGRMLR